MQDFHDIAPPLDYSLVPPWLYVVGVAAATCVVTALLWAAWRAQRRARPAPPARERAISALEKLRSDVEHLTPYEFSIRVSDVLRGYVSEQFSLPSTRQTSIEFLTAIRGANQFHEAEKLLLADFLEHCDLIKFARVAATPDDSRELLDEALQFVKGGALVAA